MKKEKQKLTRLQKKKKLVSLMALAMAITMILSSIMPYISMVFASPIETGSTMPVSISTSETVSTNYFNASESDFYSPDAFAFGKDLFDLDIEIGYDGAYIYNEYFPIKGVINNLGSEFNGRLVVKSYLNGNNQYSTIDYIEDYIDISLPANGNTSFEFNSVLRVLTENIEVSLFDNNGNEVYRNQFPVISKSPYTNLIGILSDNKDSLEYLQYFEPSKLISNYQNYGYEITDYNVFLDESNFPNNRNIMNVYKTLIIDNFHISKLSDFQIELLEEWILKGGVLILGTGVNSEKTIDNLDFLNNINFINSDVFELEYFDYEPVFISDYNFDNWNEKGFFYNYNKEDVNLFSAVKMGVGSVVICHSNFHLTPLSSNSSLTLEILDDILYNVSGEYLTNYYGKIKNSSSYYTDLYSLANNSVHFDEKDAIIPITIMAIYILIIFPIMYIFLKRKDKLELSWRLIPIIAIIFTSINFVMARFSPYKDSIVNTISLTEIKENNIGLNTEVHIGLRNALKGNVNIIIDEKLESNNNYYKANHGNYLINNVQDDVKITEKLTFSRNVGLDYIDITYHDTTSWDTNVISGEMVIPVDEFNINIYMEEDKYLGDITNNTGVDFYNVYIKIIDNVYLIGELLNGETYSVNIAINDTDKMIQDTDVWSIVDTERNGEITPKEAFIQIKETEFLNYALYKNNNQYYIPISVLGFSNKSIIDNITVNGKQGNNNNLSGYLQESKIDIKNSDYFEIAFNPNTESLGVDFYHSLDRYGRENYIYYVGEDGTQDFEYSINKELLLENIKTVEFQEQVFSVFSNIENLKVLNNKNNTWEVMEFDKPLENIQEYIYLEYGNDEEYFISIRGDVKMEMEITFPKMIVKGGK